VTGILCSCGVALYGAAPIGLSIAEITVPVESVTVSQKTITVAEKDITRRIPDVVPTQQELFVRVRSMAPENGRIDAFKGIQDQEMIFKLFFKPGEDSNIAIRKLALSKLAEVEIVKVIAEKVKMQELHDAAMTRIKSIYANERDFKPIPESQVAMLYAQRMRCSK
jgi:hypothetical protein